MVPDKTKSFCTAKEIIYRTKTQPTEWEKISQYMTDKVLISKVYKQVIQFNKRKNSIGKRTEDLDVYLGLT